MSYAGKHSADAGELIEHIEAVQRDTLEKLRMSIAKHKATDLHRREQTFQDISYIYLWQAEQVKVWALPHPQGARHK